MINNIANQSFGRSFVATILAGLCALLLAACGPSATELEAVKKAEQLASKLVEVTAARDVAQAELERRDEDARRLARQAQADRELGQFARATVRSAQLTDPAGCRIVPATLANIPHYEEFGNRLAAAYPATCRTAVSAYQAERRQVAARERAAGERQAQARQAQQRQMAAARQQQPAGTKR